MMLIDIFVMITAILLITIVMMQSSKDNIKDAFSGEKSELFKNQKARGFELFLTRATAGIALAFLILVIVAANVDRSGL